MNTKKFFKFASKLSTRELLHLLTDKDFAQLVVPKHKILNINKEYEKITHSLLTLNCQLDNTLDLMICAIHALLTAYTVTSIINPGLKLESSQIYGKEYIDHLKKIQKEVERILNSDNPVATFNKNMELRNASMLYALAFDLKAYDEYRYGYGWPFFSN